jgi:hypothetical protein
MSEISLIFGKLQVKLSDGVRVLHRSALKTDMKHFTSSHHSTCFIAENRWKCYEISKFSINLLKLYGCDDTVIVGLFTEDRRSEKEMPHSKMKRRK